MKTQKIAIVTIALMVLIFACTSEPFLPGGSRGNPNEPCPPDMISFIDQIQPLISSNCAMSGCHDAITAEEGVILDTYDNIMKEVRKGNPNNSELYKSLRDGDDIMPPPPYEPFSDAQVQLVHDWIMQDAPNVVCASDCDLTDYTFSKVIFPLMQEQCIGCHNDILAEGNIKLNTYDEIKKYVDDGSFLGSIQHDAGYVAMPPSLIPMSDCNIDKIRLWIDNGALDN